MGEGVRGAARRVVDGIRPVDGVLAGALTLLGAVLMLENIRIDDAQVARGLADGSMYHAVTSHAWAMLPLWCLATVPVLWWRRGVVAVTAIALGAVVLHDLLFGWVTRCGAGLPLAFVLASLGALVLDRVRAFVVLGLAVLLVGAVLVLDSSAGPDAAVIGLPILAIVFVVGRAVRQRVATNAELRARTVELRELRDRRAALEVAEEQASLSRRLDALLQERLAQLTAAAEAGAGLDPEDAGPVFDRIETESRATLDDMRRIVGQLRGDDVSFAPAPTVAGLDALLARPGRNGARLTVSGPPRSLPAAVELSAYRIVEHLVDVLACAGDPGVDVGLGFEDGALTIRVAGRVERAGEVRAAVTRARERAAYLGGSLDVRLSRGRATAVALLPVG